MGTQLDETGLDKWEPKPLDDETIARLKAMGARFPTGEWVDDFQPVTTRPRWLAFLIRILRLDR